MSKTLVANTVLHKILTHAGYKVGRRRRNACEFVHSILPAVWVKSVNVFADSEYTYEAMDNSWTEQVISLIEDTK